MNISGPEWETAVLESLRRSALEQKELLRKANEPGPEEESN